MKDSAVAVELISMSGKNAKRNEWHRKQKEDAVDWIFDAICGIGPFKTKTLQAEEYSKNL